GSHLRIAAANLVVIADPVETLLAARSLRRADAPAVLDQPRARLRRLLVGIGANLVVVPADDRDGVVRLPLVGDWLIVDEVLRDETLGSAAGLVRRSHRSFLDD